MNIDDVTQVEVPSGSLLPLIFAKQRELMAEYEEIEAKMGVPVPKAPWHIDNVLVQYRIKDMFWRTVEEVAEALEVIPSFEYWRERWAKDSVLRHFFEELADALHFLVEATILARPAGYENDDSLWEEAQFGCAATLDSWPYAMTNSQRVQVLASKFVWQLGLAANCLKNKPWKQTQMETDVTRFAANLQAAWLRFFHIWQGVGASLEMLYILYHKKHAVNVFRQGSKY